MGWEKEKLNSVCYETNGDTGEIKSVTPVWVKFLFLFNRKGINNLSLF